MPEKHKSAKDEKVQNLPDAVKEKLPAHAQEIYLKAHDSAIEQYKDPGKRRGGSSQSLEEVAHKVAWSAVEQEYRKNPKTGEWEKK